MGGHRRHLLPSRFQLAFRRQAQCLSFLRRQFAKLARLDVKHQRPIAHAANLLDKVPDLLKHFAQLTIAPFNQHHLKPRVVALANRTNLCRRRIYAPRTRLAALDRHAGPQPLKLLLCRPARNLHKVGLFHSRGGARELIGQFAIVGYKQQAFAEVIKPPYRVQTLRHFGE
jgi:hypothetical protein